MNFYVTKKRNEPMMISMLNNSSEDYSEDRTTNADYELMDKDQLIKIINYWKGRYYHLSKFTKGE